MRHKQSLLLPLLLLGALSFSAASTVLQGPKVTEVGARVGNHETNPATYYNGIVATEGEALLGQLHDLMVATHIDYTTYVDCKTPEYVYAMEPGSTSSYIKDFYTQEDIGYAWGGGAVGTWNREHVWCQSHSIDKATGTQLWGTSYGGSDLQHLRPIETTLNSSRNNNRYGEMNNLGLNRESYKTYSKDTNKQILHHGGYVDAKNDIFEPLDEVKGDVARILMYTFMHYTSCEYISGAYSDGVLENGVSTGQLDITEIVHTSAGSEDAAWEMLLRWNEDDPISDEERDRNDQAAIYQGNRNPFIDNSTYADKIWGDGGGGGGEETISVTGVLLDTNSISIFEAGTKQLNATVYPSTATNKAVTWTSSNTDIATVSPAGLVTGVSEGTATITVTTTDGGYTATCEVEVNEKADSATDSVTYTFSTMGYSNGESVTSVGNNNPIGMVFDKGTNNNAPKYYDMGTAVRMYGSNTLTIACSKLNIVSVGFTFASGEGSNEITTNVGTYSNGSWTGEADEIVFTVGGTSGHRRIQTITVTYQIPTLVSISTEGQTESYETGDAFDYDGVLTATYSDSSTDTVTPTSVSSPDMSSAGEKTVTITYTENGVTAKTTYTIVVTDPIIWVTGISLDKSSWEMETGDTLQLVATIAPTNATNTNVIWQSSDEEVAYVDQTGLVTAYKAGTADIVAVSEDGWYEACCALTVTSAVVSTSYKLIQSEAELLEGAEILIGATVSGNTYVAKTYTSGNNNLKSVAGSLSGNYLTPESGYGAFTLGVANDGYTFLDENDRYLYAAGGTTSNHLKAKAVLSAPCYWDISISAGVFSIVTTDVGTSKNTMRFNSTAGQLLFACYSTGQKPVQLYANVTAGVEAFVAAFLHMDDYTSNNGHCKDNEHAYFVHAKDQLLAMGSDYIDEFKNNNAFNSAQARYEAWASANNANPYVSGGLVKTIAPMFEDNMGIKIAAIAAAGILLLGSLSLVIYKRGKKE